jgi:SAM-dependent methyltransferase
MISQKNSAQNVDVRKIADHYGYRRDHWYVRTKLNTDPLYDAVYDALDNQTAPLLDIGGGMGVQAFYLKERNYAGDIHGTDYDKTKIEVANHIAAEHYPSTTFSHSDARDGIPAHSGNVTILDILQFFTPAEQAKLLSAAAQCVAPGCRLIIRSGLRDSSWRFRVTHFADIIAKLSFWMKAAPVCYPTKKTINDTLTKEGLSGSFQPMWGRTPFNNYLIVFERT